MNRPGGGHGDQDDHDRVEEGVVVVVREAGHDALQRRRRERERERAPGEDPDEPAQADRLGRRGPRSRPSAASPTVDREQDRRRASGTSVTSPTSGQPTTRSSVNASAATGEPPSASSPARR